MNTDIQEKKKNLDINIQKSTDTWDTQQNFYNMQYST